MLFEEIRKELFTLGDPPYREMQIKIIPSADPDTVIGVRTPALRGYAKQLIGRGDVSEFLSDLPHKYFDENQLHAFIISEIKDFEHCVKAVEAFLPYIDNWATCDQLSPKTFAKHQKELLTYIKKWIASDKTYTVRFGIGMLMRYFLDENFDPEYPKTVASIRSEEYYINMMIAWYFATALAKQYEAVLPFIENRSLDVRTHNKAIQKAIESFRITGGQKEYLRSLKIR